MEGWDGNNQTMTDKNTTLSSRQKQKYAEGYTNPLHKFHNLLTMLLYTDPVQFLNIKPLSDLIPCV